MPKTKFLFIVLILASAVLVSGCGKGTMNNESGIKSQEENQNNQNQQNQQAQENQQQNNQGNQNQEQPEPEVITSNVDISDWQTYNDEYYGYKFKYPNNWNVRDLSNFTPLINRSLKEIEVATDDLQQGVIYISLAPLLEDETLCEWLDSNHSCINRGYLPVYLFNNDVDYCGCSRSVKNDGHNKVGKDLEYTHLVTENNKVSVDVFVITGENTTTQKEIQGIIQSFEFVK